MEEKVVVAAVVVVVAAVGARGGYRLPGAADQVEGRRPLTNLLHP